uniref:Uncharacterized protein n=1 Tax=Glossina pallidipes TaxID=7398 RepID=A0A1A9Z3H5_GLOPL
MYNKVLDSFSETPYVRMIARLYYLRLLRIKAKNGCLMRNCIRSLFDKKATLAITVVPTTPGICVTNVILINIGITRSVWAVGSFLSWNTATSFLWNFYNIAHHSKGFTVIDVLSFIGACHIKLC